MIAPKPIECFSRNVILSANRSDTLSGVDCSNNFIPVVQQYFLFGITAFFSSELDTLFPTQGKRFAGAHGDQIAFDFGNKPESEAEYLAVERVVETVTFFCAVQDHTFLQQCSHDGHDVDQRTTQPRQFRNDQRIAFFHATQQRSEFAVVSLFASARNLCDPLVYDHVSVLGESGDFVFLIFE